LPPPPGPPRPCIVWPWQFKLHPIFVPFVYHAGFAKPLAVVAGEKFIRCVSLSGGRLTPVAGPN